MAILTPNMGLTLPTIGVDSGLTWEEGVNANSNILDDHDHSPGNGVPISASGININSNLSFNNNSAINLKSLQLTAQSSLSALRSIYSIGADLYYNDGAGNVIQMTSGGSVNATSSGISSGTATASFVSSVLVVNSAANTPANIQGGSLLIGNNVANSKFLTLAPPSAMAANFTLTLPSLPAATNIMTLDTSGNIAATLNVDNTSLQISGNAIGIKNFGVSQQAIANRLTGSTVGIGGVAISSSCGNFSTSSSSPVNVTNLSVTITTNGNPVQLKLIYDGSGGTNAGIVGAFVNASASGNVAKVYLLNGATVIDQTLVALSYVPSSAISGNYDITLPSSSVSHMDFPAAGTYTYKVQISGDGVSTAFLTFSKLVAYEIK